MRPLLLCRLLIGSTLSVGLAGCEREARLAPVDQDGAIQYYTASGTATEVVDGEHGPGARYAIYRPAEWNGRLVVYAHGFIDPAAPVALPQAENGVVPAP